MLLTRFTIAGKMALVCRKFSNSWIYHILRAPRPMRTFPLFRNSKPFRKVGVIPQNPEVQDGNISVLLYVKYH